MKSLTNVTGIPFISVLLFVKFCEKKFFDPQIFTMRLRPWHRIRKKKKTKQKKVQVFVLPWTVVVMFAISYFFGANMADVLVQ